MARTSRTCFGQIKSGSSQSKPFNPDWKWIPWIPGWAFRWLSGVPMIGRCQGIFKQSLVAFPPKNASSLQVHFHGVRALSGPSGDFLHFGLKQAVSNPSGYFDRIFPSSGHILEPELTVPGDNGSAREFSPSISITLNSPFDHGILQSAGRTILQTCDSSK